MIYRLKDSPRGWIWCLKRGKGNYGVANREYQDIFASPTHRVDGVRVYEVSIRQVWGGINKWKEGPLPASGDGWTYYHARSDSVGIDGRLCKEAEIAAIGTVQKINVDVMRGDIYGTLVVHFNAELTRQLSLQEVALKKSIRVVRDAMTAGLKDDQQASIWEIPHQEWRALLAFAGRS